MGIAPFVVSAGELGPWRASPAPRSTRLRRRRRSCATGNTDRARGRRPDAGREIQGRQGDGEQPDRAGEPDEPVRHPHRGRAPTPNARTAAPGTRASASSQRRRRASTRESASGAWCRRVPIVVTGTTSRGCARADALGADGPVALEPSRSEIAAMLHATLAPAAGRTPGRLGTAENGTRARWWRGSRTSRWTFTAAAPGCAATPCARGSKTGGSKREKRTFRFRSLAAETRRLVARDAPRGDAPTRGQQNVLDANLAREYVNAWTDN